MFLQIEGFWTTHASLSFSLWSMPTLLCSSLCLFGVIVELHVLNENLFDDFLIEK